MDSEQEQQKAQKVSEALSRIQKLPSLPNIVAEVLQNFENENIDVTTLANTIANDQALVAKVMRVANSPFFGLSGQVETIFEAISVLGFNNLRGLVTAAAFINTFPGINKRFDWIGFWRHSIATAVCAKVLARKLRLNAEAAFTAGLLHDIGKLVIGSYFPEGLERPLEVNVASTPEMLESERRSLGFDHAELGREIAFRWHFPESIREAIGRHHLSDKQDGKNTLSDVVYVANLFAHAMSADGIKPEASDELIAAMWLKLELDSGTLPELAEKADQMYMGAVMLIG